MNRYVDYVRLLKAACQSRGVTLRYKRLATGYRLYYVHLGNPSCARRVCFSAGIHGDEDAGPFAALRFVEYCDPDVYALVLPLVNPYGFDRCQRHNEHRQDINRRFCEKDLCCEAAAAYGLVAGFRSPLVVTLHEWAGRNGFYMYASDRSRRREVLRIPKIAARRFKVFSGQVINNERVDRGVIWHPDEPYQDDRSRCTLENRVFCDGSHYICLETPSLAPLESRVAVQYDAMMYAVRRLL